ncbi:MAG: AmmeMemoRadiSam system radical SAM enzyme [Verrucomicrobiae bacterium]|nr:AmmeMemoRadiSam system radical SAM enzyme [Verrucomicrobiae bacterium]
MKPERQGESEPATRQGKDPSGRGLTRRQMVLLGLAGLAGVAGTGSVVRYRAQMAEPESGWDVFRGDAPKGELWELWKQRGWAKEAYHYSKLGRNVLCHVCPNVCQLEPDDRGRCRNRVNKDGTLYTVAYGNPCSMHIDPIEKKPLFHFFPGSRSFSLATAGCVFRCLNCQNWEISQRKPEETKNARGPEFRLRPPAPAFGPADMERLSLFPEDLVALAAWCNCVSISYTYSEPTAYYEYAYDSCKLARARKIKNVFVTCGSINEAALRDVGQYLDACHVDLKGFDDDTYAKLNAGRLHFILDSLKTLQSMGVWVEIIHLVVPTYTDKPDMIRKMCDWIATNLGPDCPVHFSRFHPAHKLQHLPPTPVEILLQAQAIGRSAGLRYVYIGNVPGLRGAETTFCPNCRQVVIDRDIYSITAFNLAAGKCKFCQTKIAGVWS